MIMLRMLAVALLAALAISAQAAPGQEAPGQGASHQWSTPVARLVTTQELETLIYDVMYAEDHNDYPALVSYFTKDAHFSSPFHGDLKNRAQLRAAMAKRPLTRLTRHAIADVIIRITGPDSAEAKCIVTAFLNSGGFASPKPVPTTAAPAVADYFFKFRRANGAWLVSEKITKPIFGPRP